MLVLQKEIDNVDKLGLITAARRLLMDTYFYEFESMTNTTIEANTVEYNRWILFNDYLLRTVKKSRPGKRTLKLGDWIKLKGCQARLIDTEAKIEQEDGEIKTVYGCHFRAQTIDLHFFLYHTEKEKRDEFVDWIVKSLDASRERDALKGIEEEDSVIQPKKNKGVTSQGTSAFQQVDKESTPTTERGGFFTMSPGNSHFPHTHTHFPSPAHPAKVPHSVTSPQTGKRRGLKKELFKEGEEKERKEEKEKEKEERKKRELGHRRNKSLNLSGSMGTVKKMNKEQREREERGEDEGDAGRKKSARERVEQVIPKSPVLKGRRERREKDEEKRREKKKEREKYKTYDFTEARKEKKGSGVEKEE
eukprot:CAMPEP_0201520280 /NCGR_PEP_ID=MMETSP0161_2-20130828/10619_1 /ASSEMBLY_ACC=CAM_ASM_000251 /TAXON_ID=180227 /ORGANISM="Neoparamoeba aestuarina, Strain SoJaBio B1-5/56/2" /LENGTH=361 /DNA_ID=CAMNT_0047918595 /DNA_START=406 /DNA_END=1491 /DNA_ORIENTATION=+